MAYITTTFAGLAGRPDSYDGTGSDARFGRPVCATRDSSGNLFVVDTNNHNIRKITPAGVVTTFAGLAGNEGSTNGTGTAARFSYPNGITIDEANNLYVADTNNHVIRKITPTGVVTTFAGIAGTSGSNNGTGATFNFPEGIIIDAAGNNLYVADTSNHTIRKITISGGIITFAGLAANAGSQNGNGSAARFNFPTGIARDSSNNLYVTDWGSHTIRKITLGKEVTTLAGLAANAGSQDGNGSTARFELPTGITVDSSDNIYVADTNNSTIRKITLAGDVSTFAGLAGDEGSTDGITTARFYNPYGVFADPTGTIFVMDSNNFTIRRIDQATTATPLLVFSALLSRPRRVYNLFINRIQHESPTTYNTANDALADLTLFYETNQSSSEIVQITLGSTTKTSTVGTVIGFSSLDQETVYTITVTFSEFSFTVSLNILSYTITYNGIDYTVGQYVPLVTLT